MTDYVLLKELQLSVWNTCVAAMLNLLWSLVLERLNPWNQETEGKDSAPCSYCGTIMDKHMIKGRDSEGRSRPSSCKGIPVEEIPLSNPWCYRFADYSEVSKPVYSPVHTPNWAQADYRQLYVEKLRSILILDFLRSPYSESWESPLLSCSQVLF